MILYIHGFGSTGNSNKGNFLRQYFGNDKVLSPTLPTSPSLAIKFLEELIINNKEKNLLLVGSSLGGYYATYLGQKYSLPSILINPSIFPYITLASFVGKQKFYGKDETFNWTEKDLKELKRYETKQIDKKLFFLFLQSGDEVLDYNEAVTKFYDAQMLLIQGGSHQFDNFDKYCYLINNFYMKQFNVTSL